VAAGPRLNSGADKLDDKHPASWQDGRQWMKTFTNIFLQSDLQELRMRERKIRNPILRGFNPDPSILRVGDDYYVVTSTFEWFPGDQIHHSRDLVNWRLVSRPLDRISQLDMAGVPDSCGVWAPCMTERNGVFYLLYTNVRSFDGPFKDTPNYLVTAESVLGPWSEPVYLNSSGFDASMFHDDDGRSYVLNMVLDHRHDRLFGGIVLQEFSHEEQRLVGEIHYIFPGTEIGLTEGPHLYKRDGYYYLLTAEGGTGYDHAMTVARSRELTGPYEVHPDNPMISSKENPGAVLQKTGHGDFVETQNGEWFAVFLTGRPLTEHGRCTLGRESAIERIEWCEDGWPRLAAGGRVARAEVEAPDLPEHPFPAEPGRIDFDTAEMNIHFQSLRVPMSDDWCSLKERPGYLRLFGRESPGSTFRQSLVARRVQSHHIEAETALEFEPENFQQMAGLICYYNSCHYHYLHVLGDDYGGDKRRKFLNVMTVDRYRESEPLAQPLEITGAKRIGLKVSFHREALQFFYRLDEGEWRKIGPVLDGSILSDDYVADMAHRYRANFTGAFVGMACNDMSGQRRHADFEYFEYIER
jgi:xylan 1,4-beta-xylosidase